MYSNEVNQTGLERIKLDVNNFQTLRNHFKEMQSFIGLSLKKINDTFGHRRAEHAFYWKSTQWDLPTLETFNELIQQFRINEWDSFREYEDLRREYEDLRREYEDLRRPFDNFLNLNEVMRFNNESAMHTQYKHPTRKPEKLTRALLLTCSRPNDLVLVPFAGSGTECAMAKKENREFIGFEIDEKYHAVAMERLSDQEEKSNQIQMF
jgi:site-specific DNA-methyltransferase (adenine-specific)